MLFVNDIVLIDGSRIRVDNGDTLESKYFRFSRTKIEYMRCQFSSDSSNDEDVSLNGQVLSMKDTFRYLRSILQSDGRINEGVSHRIKTE
jgi:hypothetical protein